MEMKKVRGVIDRIEADIAVIVPDDRSREVYVRAQDLPSAQEGLEVEVFLALPNDPNGLATVFAEKKKAKPKMGSKKGYAALLRAMSKVKEQLSLQLADLEEDAFPATDIREKIAYLEEGIRLFS